MSRWALLALWCLLACPAWGGAAPEPARDRARTYLIMRLVDGLDLPAEKALALRDVFRRWDKKREALLRKREAVHQKLHAELDKHPVDGPVLAALVNDAVGLDRELATIPERSFTAAGKLLNEGQQAKLLLLRRDLQGQVHQAVRHRLQAAHHAPPVAAPKRPTDEASTARPTAVP